VTAPGLDTLADRYDIVRELGRGGMGAVYLARDRALDRPVALKVLPAEYAGRRDLRERFLRETHTAASFSHPNIVPVYAVEERDGLVAFAMGFVEGESLAQRVRRSGPLPVREAVRLLTDVGYALAYAHGRGVVHRDVKPDNVMIERATGRALLMDFGISRTVAAGDPAAAPGLTRVGEVVGTPEFMSPEQASGDAVDGRSDLYALGLVAFFAVTGEPAIAGDSTRQVIVRQLTQDVPPVASRRAGLPPALAAAIDRLTRKAPEARYPSAEALVEALESAQLAAPEVPLPVRLLAQDLGQLGILAVFIGFVAFLLQRSASARGMADVDVALPAVFLVAVLWGRLATSLAGARRVVEAGFAPPEIVTGFRRLLDEAEADRARLRALPAVRARRRRAVRAYLAMLALAALMIAWGLSLRVEVGPRRYTAPTPVVVMIFCAVTMIGLAAIGLLRNPFRPGLPERAFRAFWLGAPGRAFLGLAARGVRRDAAATVAGVAAAAPTRPVQPAPGEPVSDRLARLEARVDALERPHDRGR